MKRIFKKVLSALLTTGMLAGNLAPVTVWAADVDISEHLIAHYDFEGAEGTTVPNTCGDTFTGTLNGTSVSIGEVDIWGNVLRFSSGNDGYMSIPGIVNTGTNSYSISMWYKYDTSISRSENVALVQQNGSGRSLLLLTTGNTYRTYVNAQNVDSQNAVNLEKWQHVTYVYNSDNQEVTYYVNGELDSTSDSTAGHGANEVNALTDLYIGHHKNTDANTMHGMIDEIRIYDGVISADAAKAIYQEHATEEPDPTPGETEDIILSIHPDEVERTIDDSTIGINHRYGFNGYGSFDSETMTMREEFVELYKDAGFGSIRYPGGTISNLFQWKSTIGPVEDRVDQIHGFYNNSGQNGIAANFGLTEIAEFAHEVDSEIVYVYGFGRGSAQDAADLIEYLNAPVGSNPNGGVAWAEVRESNGQANPYNVRYFEIGNENNQGGSGGDGTWSQQYWMSYVDGGAENAYINGGTARFTQQYAVLKDNWNQAVSGSDGTADQVRYMRYANPNPMTGEDGKTLDDTFEAVVKDSVHVYVNGREWSIVDSFDGQSASAQVVTVDYRDGSFTFGDGINGAIPARGASITVSYHVERDGFVDVASAMKDTTAQINAYYAENGIDTEVECYTYSSFETQGFITRMANGGYNDLYDGLTIHPYSGTPTETSPESFYDSAMGLAESAGIAKVQNYVNMLPEGKVPVISEYGIFRSTNTQVRSQTHALYIARVLMEYVRFGSPYIQKHCLVDWYSSGADSLGPTQQAVIQAVPQSGASTLTGEGDFRFFATPSAKVFEMLKDYGTEIIASEFSKMETMSNGADLYSALVSKDEEGTIYIAIVNLDRNNAKEVTFIIDGVDANGADVTIQTLAGDTINSENALENPDNVDIETTSLIGDAENLKVELKAHSFSVIKIESFDNEKLQAKITEAEGYVEDEYTADSWNSLKAAIEAAKAVYEKGDATQVEIAEVISGLNAAMEDLVKRVDRADLQAAVKQYADFDVDGYTEESADVFIEAFSAAESVLANADASQDEISTALADLEKAVAALAVDKAELEEKIAEADTKVEDEYTISSWTRLASALSEAKRVLADEDATKDDVAAATEALTDALNRLSAPKPVIPVSAMNVTAGDSQSGQGPENALDDDSSTLWHTDWYTGPNHDNHWFQIELDEVYTVAGLRYLPRQSGPNGVITEYEIWASMDGTNWTTVAEGSWAQDAAWKEAEIDNVQAKYIRLVTVAAGSDQSIKFASAAEIRLSGILATACEEHITELRGQKEATCKEAGYTGDEVCTICGTVVKEGKEIEKPAHTEVVDEAVAATCTETGLTEGKHCSVCDTVTKEQEVVEALGHDWGDWTTEKEATTEEDGLKVRECKACGEEEEEVIEKIPVDPTPTPTPGTNPFEDVEEGKWYYDAVLWGAGNGIVNGLQETVFGPKEVCERGQIVTFLWRAEGEPKAENRTHPFSDVEEGKYYYEAMLWALEEGIIKGYSDDTFAPKETCTRSEMATILWRHAGGVETEEEESPFADVEVGKWYFDAAVWASENGIIEGYDNGLFGTKDTVTRSQTVTMLHRYYTK